MTDERSQADTDSTFYAAEQTGLRLAIKGRLIAVCGLCLFLAISREPERAAGFAIVALVFTTLGILHYLIIGSKFDRKWVKYVFSSIDISLLSFAVAFVSPTPEVQLDQIFMFKFDTFPYYFIILGVAAFSFSPGLVLWSGLFGAGAWLGAYAWVASRMQNRLEWSDIPVDPTKEQFLNVFLSEDFAGSGSRFQEIAIVMHRARQTVWRQLEAERGMTSVSQMFGRFVPKSVVEIMIKEKGALDPIERQATVLFTDLAGFTNLTEAKGPRAIVDILNAYFDAATEIISKNNGVVTQFQGDAILAIFNVPFEDEHHAQHAFDSATELLQAAR